MQKFALFILWMIRCNRIITTRKKNWSAPVSDAGKLAQLPQTQGPAESCDKPD
jgi:hypothetical protein